MLAPKSHSEGILCDYSLKAKNAYFFQYNFNDFSKLGYVFLRYNRTKIEWKMKSELEGLIFPYFFAEIGSWAVLEAS